MSYIKYTLCIIILCCGVCIHGHMHTTVEHEESEAGHSMTAGLVDWDLQTAKGLHHLQLILR